MSLRRVLRAIGYVLVFDARSLKTSIPFLERVMQEQLARERRRSGR